MIPEAIPVTINFDYNRPIGRLTLTKELEDLLKGENPLMVSATLLETSEGVSVQGVSVLPIPAREIERLRRSIWSIPPKQD